MKRHIFLVFALLLGSVASSFAAEHGEAGVYGEYLRFQGIKSNLVGVGGRLSFNVHQNIQLEAEMGYLFRRGFVETYSNGIPNSAGTTKSSVRALYGLFGPKLQLRGPIKPFVTVKGGFFNTEFNGQSPGAGFISQINNLRANRLSAVLYPGGGIETFLGPVGLRLDVGDEIIFTSTKANHNLRITFGPHIRF